MKKLFIVFAITGVIATAFTGCTNEGVEEHINQNIEETVVTTQETTEETTEVTTTIVTSTTDSELIGYMIDGEMRYASLEYWHELGYNSLTNTYTD